MRTALGYRKDGGWQQYIVLPSQLCFVLPPTMMLKQSVFCQPLSTILRGWDNMGKVALDSKVLIVGAGTYSRYYIYTAKFMEYLGGQKLLHVLRFLVIFAKAFRNLKSTKRESIFARNHRYFSKRESFSKNHITGQSQRLFPF